MNEDFTLKMCMTPNRFRMQLFDSKVLPSSWSVTLLGKFVKFECSVVRLNGAPKTIHSAS